MDRLLTGPQLLFFFYNNEHFHNIYLAHVEESDHTQNNVNEFLYPVAVKPEVYKKDRKHLRNLQDKVCLNILCEDVYSTFFRFTSIISFTNNFLHLISILEHKMWQ